MGLLNIWWLTAWGQGPVKVTKVPSRYANSALEQYCNCNTWPISEGADNTMAPHRPYLSNILGQSTFFIPLTWVITGLRLASKGMHVVASSSWVCKFKHKRGTENSSHLGQVAFSVSSLWWGGGRAGSGSRRSGPVTLPVFPGCRSYMGDLRTI